jgi:hypothetical protein
MTDPPSIQEAWREWDKAWHARENAPPNTSNIMYEYLLKEEAKARKVVIQAHAYHHPEHHEDSCPLLRFRLDQMRHSPDDVT